MKIVNEQYKGKCSYSDFKIVSMFDEIISIKYEKDGSFIVKMKSDYPSSFRFTAFKKV